jgi:hypothetical protein
MDPKLIRLLTVLGAVALYVGASYLPTEVQSVVREAGALVLGWAGLRRPGDLGPDSGKGDS